MKYRKLGNTGLDVSILGFGGSSLGGAFHDIDEADGIKAVHLALDCGINLLDTAPFYGLTKAEAVMGRALRGIPRDRYLLATKVARYGNEPQDFDFSAGRVALSVDESLARLGVEYVDFIQVHDIEFGDINQVIDETIPALREAQSVGKARFVGISGLPVHLFARVMDRVDVDQIQSYCHYCLNDTALTGLLPRIEESGIALFNSAPLAMRLLSDEGPPDWHPAPAALKEKCAEAAALCRARGTSIGKLALQFSVANPRIPVNIVGTASPERVLENLRVIEDPIDEDLLAGVLRILEPVHNITWPSGRPANN